MREFSGRTAVITGGASGIGWHGSTFAARHATGTADLMKTRYAEQEFAQAGVAVECRLCDASKLEDIEGLAKVTIDRFGGVHVACGSGVVFQRRRVTSNCPTGNGS